MINKNKKNEILKRLYNVVPVGTLQMQEMLSLLNIELTDDDKYVQSACITCKNRPAMILNVNFINEYCKTDEHLFMLVMHELYHKILGHTTLFKRHDMIDNIAFDAIINAMLCKEFPDEEYVSFFTSTNKSSEIPSCILRPRDDNTPSTASNILKELYESNTGTYYDVYQYLKEVLKEMVKNSSFMLIGSHKGDGDMNNSLLNEYIEKIIEKWPRPPRIIEGRDDGGEKKEINVLMDKKIKMKKNFRKLLSDAGIEADGVNRYKKSFQLKDINIQTFFPEYKNRTSMARKELVKNNVIYNKNIEYNVICNEKQQKTYIYLDVSGSVYSDLINMAPLLIKPYKNKEIELYAFSTIVEKVRYKNFINGKFNSTGGTDINCILKHLLSLEKHKMPKKILIFTDGYVGAINKEYEKEIKDNKIQIYVGLFGKFDKSSLKNISKKIVEVG